jgi:hypothetical protein
MAGAIKPILNGIYVCDDVVGNPVGGKPMIVNLFDSVRVPVGGGFPHTHAKLCVFAWLRGGRGRARFRIEIVSPPHANESAIPESSTTSSQIRIARRMDGSCWPESNSLPLGGIRSNSFAIMSSWTTKLSK